MKPRSFPFALLFATLTTTYTIAQIKEPLLEGPYLGQKPPGSVAEVFAPGIVSTPHFDAFGVFSPDLYLDKANLTSIFEVTDCDIKPQEIPV